MRIRTNTGIVELTAEMITKGMVFMVFDSAERMGGRFVIIRDFGDDNWTSSRGTSWHLWKAVRAKQVQFVGLDARYASMVDVDRLCCGALREDVTKSVKTNARCTLAIGDHDMHEELSTGARWSAAKRAITPNSWAGDAVDLEKDSMSALIQQLQQSPKFPYSPAPILAMQRLAKRVSPTLTNGTRTPCPECHADTLCSNGTYHHDHCPVARRAHEAPIVALVNAVPEGLDPIGWRAAVLAVHECQSRYGSPIHGDHFAAWLMHSLREDIDDCDAGTPYVAGYRAYLRAIDPVAKVTPERKVKTAETLSIRLPDDDDIGW